MDALVCSVCFFFLFEYGIPRCTHSSLSLVGYGGGVSLTTTPSHIPSNHTWVLYGSLAVWMDRMAVTMMIMRHPLARRQRKTTHRSPNGTIVCVC